MRKLLHALGFFAVFLISCSGNDEENFSANPGLLKTFTTHSTNGDYLVVGNFLYQQNKLSKISTGPGSYAIYGYTGEQITSIKFYASNTLTEEISLEYDNQGRLSEMIRRQHPELKAFKIVHEYNADGSFWVKAYQGDFDSQSTLYQNKQVFFENGEVSRIDTYDPATNALVQTRQYVYDDKFSPYYGIVGYAEAFSYEAGVMGIRHNVLAVNYTYYDPASTATDIILESTYNDQGYLLHSASNNIEYDFEYY